MAYVLMKRIITRGGYDVVDVQNKLDVYYGVGRLTDEQYQELCAMIAPVTAE